MGLVAFVANKHDSKLLIGIVFGLFEALPDAIEGVAVGYVVHENGCY